MPRHFPSPGVGGGFRGGTFFGGPRTLKRNGARIRQLYGGGIFLVVVAGFALRPPP
nr:MAG TPA: hypothetical protein [Caudoviricetes sp.]